MPRPQDDEKRPLSPSDYNAAASFGSISSIAPSVSESSAEPSPRIRKERPHDIRKDGFGNSIARPPSSSYKALHSPGADRSSLLRLVSVFRRRHPYISILLAVLFMIIITLVILLVLSVTHLSSMGHAWSSSTSTSASNTILPSASIHLNYLGNFPDPSLFYDNSSSTWYIYGTNPNAGILSLPNSATNPQLLPAQTLSTNLSHTIQLLSSSDLQTWTTHADPMENEPLGAWVHPSPEGNPFNPFGNVWAPDVLLHPLSTSDSPHYILYYSATSAQYPAAHCLGAASASSPLGPFTSHDESIACPGEEGGAIDGAIFVDDTSGTGSNTRGVASPPLDGSNPIYLLYKVDGNSKGHGGSCGNSVAPQHSTPIQLQLLDDTGLAPAVGSPPLTILDRTAEDGPLVEAPALVKVGGIYVLFYSSGCTREDSYDVRYATSDSIFGPYTRRGTLLRTGDYGLEAPGSVSVKVERAGAGSTSLVGASIGEIGDRWIMAFAGRVSTQIGGVRALLTVRLTFGADGSVDIVQDDGGVGADLA